VVVEGPVASRRLGCFRVFRYEVRRWRDGAIADADQAVASPQLLSGDPLLARRLLDLVGCLPSPVWGRDELGAGEMWNSNSVISWLLARSGLPTNEMSAPAGGRAPGWEAGLVMARRQPGSDERAGHGAGTATARVGGRGGQQRLDALPQRTGRQELVGQGGHRARVVMSGDHHTHNPSNPCSMQNDAPRSWRQGGNPLARMP
jgi:hypothetical protein